MKLVFLHGRAQGGKNPSDLKEIWLNTFAEGLTKSQLKLDIDDIDVIFPFYGDELDTMTNDFYKATPEIIKKGTELTTPPTAFTNFLEEIAENEGLRLDEIQKNSGDEILERGPLNWGWTQALLRALDRHGKWGEIALRKYTFDVFLYLTVPAIREKIDEIVTSQLPKDDEFVLVSHSLGTVISYNVLIANPELEVKKFITIGSPLGLKSVKRYLKAPLQMPRCVKNGWYNAYDDGDVVALNPLNKQNFFTNPEIVNSNHVNNSTDNQHGIEGYLDDSEIAKTIYDNLS
ncbi:hypothetical protein [Flavobacterium sp.]|uniref:hypothetical protein n=1 Tax=Flavobacterium sp. TaxID=239 RepID=UPI00121C6037|nr:hypothetical protein [Flavobacterium sp.]RZJ72569.1 MAG: alpha/beta hydrolase [Flavobacterium sp.]